MQGRAPGEAGGLRARGYIKGRLAEIGVTRFTEDFEHRFDVRDETGRLRPAANLVGFVPGTQNGRPYIVVTAHYDHLGVRNGQVFNGADDNASGVAALLALAAEARRNPFQHPLVFAALDGEEGGLRGAYAFVENPPIPRAQIALNINLDMVARADDANLWVVGLHHHPQFRSTLQTIPPQPLVRLAFGHDRPEQGDDDWTNQSDQFAFHEAGIPFIFFSVENHADYHQSTDDTDRIDPIVFDQALQLIIVATRRLDAAMANGGKTPRTP